MTCMPEFDANTPSIARLYDYWLGGKDSFAADRELGERLLAMYPATADIVRENKQFLTRAVGWVAGQGISQFIDLGAGMPTSPNTQQTAQEFAADVKVAYIDNDPVVQTHLTALLAKGSSGITVVNRDVTEVEEILREVAEGLDLRAPSCLIMGSLLHFFPPEVAQDLVDSYVAALAPGSYVIVSVGRSDGSESAKWIKLYRQGGSPLYYYSATAITKLLGSLELVRPGITEARVWRPGWAEVPRLPPRTGDMLAAVARVLLWT